VGNREVVTGIHDFRIAELELVLFPSPLKKDVGKGKETLRIQSVHLQCDTDRNRTFTETNPRKNI